LFPYRLKEENPQYLRAAGGKYTTRVFHTNTILAAINHCRE
jgi:hypothetical protein